MNVRAARILLLIAGAALLVATASVIRQLSFVSVGLGAHAEVEQQLRQSLDDQKRLARLDPPGTAAYRRRFDSIVALRQHLQVLQLNRLGVARQVERMILGSVAFIVISGVAVYLVERRSRERRLVRLETALDALSRGDGPLLLGDRRRDLIGRIAASLEKSSRAAAADRRRLRYLEHLSGWQEAARRHAHEMRTPLTAARMDVERFAAAVRKALPSMPSELQEVERRIFVELDNLRDFTRQFTSFATIPKPRLRPLELQQLVGDFCNTFRGNWPNLTITRDDACGESVRVEADGEMLRQVLMNLAANSALAVGSRAGTLTFRVGRQDALAYVDAADDGPGIAPEIRGRLFEPYATTRGIGEGMGLGLAISKKIMLDHGGDLDVVESARGAVFRLTLPAAEAAA